MTIAEAIEYDRRVKEDYPNVNLPRPNDVLVEKIVEAIHEHGIVRVKFDENGVDLTAPELARNAVEEFCKELRVLPEERDAKGE